LENKCSQAENVVKSDDCDKIVVARYDHNLAYKMIFLCAIAYSDNVGRYLSRATEVNTFHLVKQVIPGHVLEAPFVLVLLLSLIQKNP
jgi:hypothetical protein